MYPEHRAAVFLVWLSTLIGGICFNVPISAEICNQALTVLSILFGFYITSATMVSSSPIFRKLHKQEDLRKHGKQRLSQTLTNYFRFGLMSLLLGIFIFLLVTPLIMYLGKNGLSVPALKDTPICLPENLLYPNEVLRLLSAIAYAQLACCLIFSFIKTRLFLNLFLNNAYCQTNT